MGARQPVACYLQLIFKSREELGLLVALALEMGHLSRFLLKIALKLGNMPGLLFNSCWKLDEPASISPRPRAGNGPPVATSPQIALKLGNMLRLLLADLGKLDKTGRNLSGRIVSIEQIPGIGAVAKILKHSELEDGECSIRADAIE